MSANVQNTEPGPAAAPAGLKNLGLAFLLVLAAAAVAFFVLSKFGVQTQVAGPIAGSFFSAITVVSSSLDASKAGHDITLRPRGVVAFAHYTIPAHLMFLYFVLILLAMMEVSSVISGVVAAYAKVPISAELPLIMGFSWIINGSSVFLLSKWVGRHSAGWSYLVVVAGCAAASLLGHLLDLAMASVHNKFVSLADMKTLYGQSFNLHFILLIVAGGAGEFAAVGLLGCWRGEASRLSAYLVYLMKRIPPATRDVMVDMAYEEAQRLSKPV